MNEIVPSAVVLDIDGTLINDQKSVTPFTRSEIGRVRRDYGTAIILASARMPRSIRTIFEQIGCRTPISAYSGGYTEFNESALEEKTISPESAMEFITRGWSDSELHVGVFLDDDWYVQDIDYWALREVRGCGVWPRVMDLRGISSLVASTQSVRKIMLRGPRDAIRKFGDSTGAVSSVTIHRSDTQYEVYPRDCSKSSSLELILQNLGLSLKQAIAFGDSDTDASMIASAGIGIAMGNATDYVKSLADEITLSNCEDGVGLMLRKYFPAESLIVPMLGV